VPSGGAARAQPSSISDVSGARIRIVLDLDPAADPIAGSIAVGDRPAAPFSGWLQLAEVLTTATDSSPPQPEDGS
jgi:hypothetical protein